MTLTLPDWRTRLKPRWRGWAADPRGILSALGSNSLYFALGASALYPLAVASAGADPAATASALTALGVSVGTDLLANAAQDWADEADGARRLAAAATAQPDVRTALDQVLLKLDALGAIQPRLEDEDRVWFEQTLRAALAEAGSTLRMDVTLNGSGAAAVGHGNEAVRAGGALVEGNVGGDVRQQSGGVSVDGGVQAEHDVVAGTRINVPLTEYVRQVTGQREPPLDLRQALARYLQYVADRYRYLDFRGMGISDRVPPRMALIDLYVPLKARIQLPRGEPVPLQDLLARHSGLVILGDPGSGKTTFLKHLALTLAIQAGAEARLPLLVPLSAYANAITERDVRLDDFVAGYFYDLGEDLPIADLLRQALRAGRAVVMLDGLDEVRDTALRETVTRRVLDFYTFHRRAGNKFLLTSRIIGYHEVRMTAEGLGECTLVDFGDEEIQAFVTRWCSALEKAARGDTPFAVQEAGHEQAELLDAIAHNAGVRHLAANPLLLTILALMKRQGVALPERRAELYDRYIQTLLSSWNRARGPGWPPARDLSAGSGPAPSLRSGQALNAAQGQALDLVETVKVLAPLALWMHEVNPGAGLVKRHELLGRLEAIFGERGEANPAWAARRFLADVREYGGLLLEQGAERYGFVHHTFEEYLAAVALAQRGQQSVAPVVAALSAHVDDPAWRETSLLTVGYLGLVQRRDEAASVVVEQLIAGPANGATVELAGAATADVWPGGVTPASKARVVTALVEVVQGQRSAPAQTRVRAGDTLARLGDPRDLEELIEIPAGPFWMGSDKQLDQLARDSERPLHEMYVAAFKIGKYAVTVGQWRTFATATHYAGDARALGDSLHHPVRYVSWQDAQAYCAWLTEQWCATGKIARGEIARLPTEAQWEKAARGIDRRVWSWGDEAPEEGRCNFHMDVGSTTAVGCYPQGASPYGVLDMAGNVWEWCSSLYKAYPYRADDGREDMQAGGTRVLRGGSFGSGAWGVRCACRRGSGSGYRDFNSGFRAVVFFPAPGG